jgi:hypothetical protein
LVRAKATPNALRLAAMSRKPAETSDAVRDALQRLHRLEVEKDQLLSSLQDELATMANLYIATYQLHSTLDLSRVVRHLRELLGQFVGAEAFAFYLHDVEAADLAPVFCDGIELDKLPRLALTQSIDPKASDRPLSATWIERAYATGEMFVREMDLAYANFDAPVACIPMRIEDRVMGVVVVYLMLAHKQHLLPIDRELFKMLGAHAAPALTAALLYNASKGASSSLLAFENLESPVSARTIPPGRLRK